MGLDRILASEASACAARRAMSSMDMSATMTLGVAGARLNDGVLDRSRWASVVPVISRHPGTAIVPLNDVSSAASAES